ncbi:hypothetical protein, partial [Microvirga yunnanensis]|uniref:hypothetical protein n=1 Tax=Microvirga yunnanensis TaxID=2953740 RepID=UPI0021C9B5D9
VTELHVESHLAVGDVAAGQRVDSSFGREEACSLPGRPRRPDGAIRTDRTVTSHSDRRSTSTLIAAP